MKNQAEKQLIIILLAVLTVLCAVLWIYPCFSPEPTAVVANKTETLYDALRVPHVPTEGRININEASAALLDTLPGIGPALSERIIAHRKENGPFYHPIAILEVRGIGEKLYEEIKDRICTE